MELKIIFNIYKFNFNLHSTNPKLNQEKFLKKKNLLIKYNKFKINFLL